MSALSISLLAVAASFAGALLAMITGLVAPRLSARLQRRTERSSFIRQQRRDAYVEFATCVEKAQRKADFAASGAPTAKFGIGDLDDVEISRVRIDMFGTHAARVWAYRCTLSLIGLVHVLADTMADSTLPRAKLHEARKCLIGIIRYELGVSDIEAKDRVSRKEAMVARRQIERLRRPQTNADHLAWLQTLPEDSSALSAGAKSVEDFRAATAAAEATIEGSKRLAEPADGE